MDKNYDYIGGVWFDCYAEATNENSIWLPGNGGLSLRKVKSFVGVINSTKKIESIYEVVSKIVKREYSIRSIGKAIGIQNNVKWFVENYMLNEDVLFAVEIPRLIKFRVLV